MAIAAYAEFHRSYLNFSLGCPQELIDITAEIYHVITE